MKVNPQSFAGSPGRPSWSADSRRVAVNLNRKAFVIEKDTQSALFQIEPDADNVGAPQFSPDGKKLAYDVFTSVPGASKKQWAIAVAQSDGSNPDIIVEHGRTPRWNPQGDKLAFSSYTDDFRTKVSLVDLETKQQSEGSKVPHLKDFSWSPDGKKLAYEGADVNYDLRVVDLENDREAILTDGQENAFYDRSPVWSPSGKTIAFERRYKQFPAASLWTADAESGSEKQLFQQFSDVVDPVFTPDGETLIFGSNHGGRGGLDLFAMDLDDLSVTQLTNIPGDEHSPSISPDGKTIAFLNTDRRRESGQQTSLHFQALSQ